MGNSVRGAVPHAMVDIKAGIVRGERKFHRLAGFGHQDRPAPLLADNGVKVDGVGFPLFGIMAFLGVVETDGERIACSEANERARDSRCLVLGRMTPAKCEITELHVVAVAGGMLPLPLRRVAFGRQVSRDLVRANRDCYPVGKGAGWDVVGISGDIQLVGLSPHNREGGIEMITVTMFLGLGIIKPKGKGCKRE